MMPRSRIKAIITELSPAIEKKPGNIIAVTINEPSMRPNIIKNKVLRITPTVHTHFLPINVPKANRKNKQANAANATVHIIVPKSSKGYNEAGPEIGQVGIIKT